MKKTLFGRMLKFGGGLNKPYQYGDTGIYLVYHYIDRLYFRKDST